MCQTCFCKAENLFLYSIFHWKLGIVIAYNIACQKLLNSLNDFIKKSINKTDKAIKL